MPQPLLAVGLATALVQTIDFSINTLSENRTIHPNSNGASPDNHMVLRDITNNFHRLSSRISENYTKRRVMEKKNAKLSEAEQYLLELSDKLKELVDPLRDAFLHVVPPGSYYDPKWGSAREALLTVWKEKDITTLMKKLKVMKKEVDGTLLVALRWVSWMQHHQIWTDRFQDNISIRSKRKRRLFQMYTTPEHIIGNGGSLRRSTLSVRMVGSPRIRSTSKSSPPNMLTP
jgi:hypothetical protein